MERDQELIDRIRRELGLSRIEFTDDDVWEKVKGTFLAQRIAFGISIDAFKKSVCDLVSGFKKKNNNRVLEEDGQKDVHHSA